MICKRSKGTQRPFPISTHITKLQWKQSGVGTQTDVRTVEHNEE